jgi:hypothetical protein
VNKHYRVIGTDFHGKSADGKLRDVFVDNSQKFPNHLYFVADQIHLPREEVVKLRDFLTDWLERDPDADLIKAISEAIESSIQGKVFVASQWREAQARAALAAVREYMGENA